MKKKIKDAGSKILLFAGSPWSGLSTPFASSSWTTVDGTVSMAEKVLNGAINLSGLIAVAILVMGAYKMITSAGDPGKIEEATGTITNAIIGLVVVFVARLIIFFVIDNLLS